MLKKILARLMMRHYFWRDVGFDELSELYISNMLRTFALSLLMVFIPFYLYQHGYSISLIFLVFAAYFGVRIICDIVAALSVGRYGPKHTMIISCFLQIASAALFLTVPQYHWPFWILGPVYGSSASFFFIAYHTEFSKIKHAEHAGKELSHMQIMQQIAGVIGPLAGGFAANEFGGQAIFLLAVGFLFGSLLPLFRTAEPVKTHQHINYSTLPWKQLRRTLFSYSAAGIENCLCINIWPFYLSLFALTGAVYAELGTLTAFGVLASIGAAYTIGHIVDSRHGRRLLRLSATLNALLYVFRPLVHSLWPAFLINMTNETVTSGYRMPMTKGMYGAADELPGHRIAFISVMEALGSVAKALTWLVLAILAQFFSARATLEIGFAIAAVASLLIMTERYHALDVKENIIKSWLYQNHKSKILSRPVSS